MHQEDLDTLRSIFDHFAEGDFAAAVRHYDPEVEWIETRGVPGHGGFRGLPALKAGFTDWLSVWDDYRCEVEQLIDAGERAVAEVRGSGRGRMSGAETSEIFFQVWSLRGGRVVRIENHRTREQAMEAAGVPAGDGGR
jgi:ketosteroid isomerase-like protein